MTIEMKKQAYCRKCSYLLRGIGEAGKCPECGDAFDLANARTFRRRPARAWKRHALRIGIAAIIVAAAGYGLYALMNSSWMNQWKGRWEADKQWRDGNAVAYYGGLVRIEMRVDAHTGLPVKWVYGCRGDDEYEAIQEGHNERIAELIAEQGPPAYSYLAIEPGVCDMPAMWARRVSAGERAMVLMKEMESTGEAQIACGKSKHTVFAEIGLVRIDGNSMGREVDSIMFNLECLGGEKSDDVIYLRWRDYDRRLKYGATRASDQKWLRTERE